MGDTKPLWMNGIHAPMGENRVEHRMGGEKGKKQENLMED